MAVQIKDLPLGSGITGPIYTIASDGEQTFRAQIVDAVVVTKLMERVDGLEQEVKRLQIIVKKHGHD